MLVIMAIMLLLPSTVFAAVELRSVNAEQYFINSQSQRINLYGMSVAQLIASESTEHNINPRMIIAILQRESSAVTQTTPSSSTREAWPMFYNYDERMADCLNGNEASCTDSKYSKDDYQWRAINFGGIGQQIAYSAYNFERLYNTYRDSYSTPVTIDDQTVVCENIASRVMYAYTPHITAYNADSNFYKYYLDYWGAPPTPSLSINNIISDANFTNSSPMTAEQIQAFLTSKGSWMASYGPGNLIPQFISVSYPAIAASAPSVPARKAGDANGDYAIDSTDLSILADQWGKNVTANTGADYNSDSMVDSTDLSILADAWGK